MKAKGWDVVVLSDPDHEHLVAELHYDGQFLLLLDREQGRDSICVAFADNGAGPKKRVPIHEFIDALLKAAEELKT